MGIMQLVVQPFLLLFVFSMLMSDFFDTMGTVFAVGQRADFTDKDGNVAGMRTILTIDSIAAAVGGFFGASSITCYAESVSGAAAGARTGFSNVIVALGFVLCAFLAPIIGMVSSSATCGALVVVGYLMMCDIGKINWISPEVAFPSFLIVLGIPMTYSITNGIGLGFIFYCIIMVFRGKWSEVHPLMWVSSLAFLLSFILI